MRVLLVSGSFPEIRCGVGDYTARLAAELAAWHEVHVLSSRGADPGAVPGVTVHALMERWSRSERPRVTELLSKLSPELVHLQFPSRMGVRDRGYLANALPGELRRRGLPLVLTLHEFAERRLRFRLRAWWNAHHADAVIYTGADDRRIAWRWPGLAAKRDAVVPIAPNVDPVHPPIETPARLRARLGLPEGARLAVHFGVLDGDRGLESLDVLARRMGEELAVVVVGEVAPGSSPELGRPVRDGALRLPALPAPELSALLTAADLGVFPFAGGASRRRGSLLAAMGHGLPVVTTQGPFTPASWEGEHTLLLVPAGDAPALEAAVRRLLSDPALCARLGSTARRAVATPGWPEIARAVDGLYAQVKGGEA